MAGIRCKLVVILLVMLLPCVVQAQGLSEQQYQTLRNDILVTHQAEFAEDVANNNDQKIADAYNALQAPTFFVWKTLLTEQEIYESTSSDTNAPTWSWSTYKSQAVQERDAWNVMMRPSKINPSLKQTRDAFGVIFGGQGASAIQNAFLLALSKRPARRIEALLFLPNLGNGTLGNPANMGFEGGISRLDIAHCLRGAPLS